ncbi:hypothetical protein F5148DRAFT_236671 [Russula earlei]|uniref:Uncharacterized protein n=1 Tax=Russula earlei TaxID=71964 RepID=A0ACC0U3W0_9AGAM|nr:hypothetical protein F5148DRAFT_236671 [Russula earlei]
MGNALSRNDHYPVPPGFTVPVYPGYPQFSTPSTWNPFKRNQMKKREKVLREYLYTTPMILQYPGAFAVSHPGQNLVQPGIPQVHNAVSVAPVAANGMATQMSAPMVVTGAPPPAPGAGGAAAAAAPVIPPQMAPITYPATFDYSAFLDPRGTTDPVVPRRSHRRSQRHNNRSRRRSPTPSSGSSASDTESPFSDPSSYDSAEYPRRSRHRRSSNPLPRPPKDILASTPFRPLLTQLPSAQYNSWGLGHTNSQPQPQSQPQQTTYSNVRPRRRRGFFNRQPRATFPVVPSSLADPSSAFARSFMAPMAMPAPQNGPPLRQQLPPPAAGPAMAAPAPPVLPQNITVRMPAPEPAPPAHQGPPVIPPGTPMFMSMPNPGHPGSTPFIGANLGTPRTLRTAPVPPPGQVAMGPIPPLGPCVCPRLCRGEATCRCPHPLSGQVSSRRLRRQ